MVVLVVVMVVVVLVVLMVVVVVMVVVLVVVMVMVMVIVVIDMASYIRITLERKNISVDRTGCHRRLARGQWLNMSYISLP